jgi:hypothetical protein
MLSSTQRKHRLPIWIFVGGLSKALFALAGRLLLKWGIFMLINCLKSGSSQSFAGVTGADCGGRLRF